jgi:hypothetical protein
VHIVEWLRPGDMRTGLDLFNELEPIEITSNPEIPVDFSCVSTRAEFVALLRVFEEDLRTTGRLHTLHIETHGSDDGIGVSHTEGLSFRELTEELIPLNMLSRLHLFVVLAACEGVWGIRRRDYFLIDLCPENDARFDIKIEDCEPKAWTAGSRAASLAPT